MWKIIADMITENTGKEMTNATHELLSLGGENRLAYKLSTNLDSYFVKIAPKMVQFAPFCTIFGAKISCET